MPAARVTTEGGALTASTDTLVPVPVDTLEATAKPVSLCGISVVPHGCFCPFSIESVDY